MCTCKLPTTIFNNYGKMSSVLSIIGKHMVEGYWGNLEDKFHVVV